MTEPRRAPEGPHHFRAPDPADLVVRPASASGSEMQGPRPPRPWYALVAGQWPLFVTLCVVTAGVVTAGASYWRRGSTIIGAGVLLGALLRLVLPEKTAGLLCCRRRSIDVMLTLGLGVGIIALAWLIDPTRR